MDFDPGDQRADHRRCLCPGLRIACQCVRQILDSLCISLGRGWVQCDGGALGLERVDFRFDRIAFRLQAIGVQDQSFRCGAGFDRLNDLPHLEIDRSEPRGQLVGAAGLRFFEARKLFVIFLDRRGAGGRVDQKCLEAAEGAALQFGKADSARVGACAPIVAAIALHPVLVFHRIRAVAYPAADQAGQQVRRPAAVGQGLAGDGLAAGFDGSPHVVADNAQLGHLLHFPFGGILDPRTALSAVGVLNKGLSGVDQPPAVDRIVQDAGQPGGIAHDR
ncbi:hypothetical protein WG924_12035 [Tistrella sp. 25B02-3]